MPVGNMVSVGTWGWWLPPVSSPVGGGSLSFTGVTTTTTVDLHYKIGAEYNSGTIYARRARDGFTASQAVASGTQTFTGLKAGERYEFYVVPLNDNSEPNEISNIVTVVLRDESALDDEYWYFKWRSEDDTWHSEKLDMDLTRRRIKTNEKAHIFQWAITNDTPNTKLVIRNVHLEVRMRGKEYTAEQQ